MVRNQGKRKCNHGKTLFPPAANPRKGSSLSSALILNLLIKDFDYNYDVCLLRMPQGLSLAIQHHRSVSKGMDLSEG